MTVATPGIPGVPTPKSRRTYEDVSWVYKSGYKALSRVIIVVLRGLSKYSAQTYAY